MAKTVKKATTSPSDMPWRDAIIQIMHSAKQAMHYNAITEAIINQKLRTTLGATPKNTVYNYLNEEFKKKGTESGFIKTGPGEFILGDEKAVGKKINTKSIKKTSTSEDKFEDFISKDEPKDDEQEDVGAIQAFGMFWRREAVHWKSNLKLFGQQDAKSEKVDFAKQKGVYLLHDGQRTVYVGRVAEQSLGARLYQHTTDRLNGRWDRFSWFGLSKVTDAGELEEQIQFILKPSLFIATLEALLIETVEPPLNRKRGDDFQAAEYLQAEDPDFQKQKQKLVMSQLSAKITKAIEDAE